MKTTIGVGVTVALITIFSLTRCKPYKIYEISTPQAALSDADWEDSLSNIRIFLEVSYSMRGYVNPHNVHDSGYIIRTVVPFLITDCSEFSCDHELWTISNAPERYIRSDEEFIENLRSGSLMTAGSSRIHDIIEHVIETSPKNGISYLITDCIPDISDTNPSNGKTTNQSLTEITTKIDNIVRRQKVLGVFVFVFQSEFNGQWYYDQANNQPFKSNQRILHDRPLYVWMFGRPDILAMALKKGLLSNTSRYSVHSSFVFHEAGLKDPDLELMSYPILTKAYIVDPKTTAFKKYSPAKPVTLVMGIDLNNLPAFAQKPEYWHKNASFSPEHLKKDNSVELLDRESLELLPYYTDIASQVAKTSYQHFFHISIGNINTISDDFSINLEKNKPEWIQESHLETDLSATADMLKGKTFGLSYIMNGFLQGFHEDGKEANQLLELKFTQKPKK